MAINLLTLEKLRVLQFPGEPSVIVELIDVYLADSPQKMDGIRQSLSVDKFSAVSKLAHGLKSSSFTLGAEHLGHLCEQLENCREPESLKLAQDLTVQIESEFGIVVAELKVIRDKETLAKM